MATQTSWPFQQSHPLRLIKRWPTPGARLWTEEFLASAKDDENIVAVVAIGSAVRPSVTSVDLDLVVICKDPTQLTRKPPIEIDLRAYAADQVDNLIGTGSDLLGWAVKYGYALLQKDGYWDRLLTTWRDRVPLPSVDIATRRAVKALHRLTDMLNVGDYQAAYEQAMSYVTHLARAELLRKGRYPTSRPELPKELRAVGSPLLANCLERLINREVTNQGQLVSLVHALSSDSDKSLSSKP